MTDSSHSEQIGRLLDDYLDRLRQGQSPTIDDYLRKHPALADEIRQTFSAVLMLQNLESGQSQSRSGESIAADTKISRSCEPPKRLGEFRIVREIGRGGMGVVYEAVQESLSRTVALKILPRQLFQQPKLVERFQHEARAVAGLHHTNIVPVFSVGQQDDVFHFAMQFIDGIGIDEVINRLRDSNLPDIRHEISLIGNSPPKAAEATALNPSPDHMDETGEHISLTESQRPGLAEPAPPSPSFAMGSDTANSNHFRKIAQLGLHVADALQHAHDRGILHRDIKPSNLMIDRQGNVWVTDFGLAKAQETNMTQTGDIVGTLQYMPPERLKGTENATGDVFSLGLTLYELVTLTPAYFGVSQADLIAQILNGTPRRIRDINSRVPRDLETIIHKSMSPETGMRYASARLMAEDLDRFLAGRAIRARPTGPIGRATLWARRNPVPAGLLSLVSLLLVVLVVGSLFAAIRFANDNQLITEHLNRSIEAEREKGLALLDSKIAQAKALLESTQVGRSPAIREVIVDASALSRELNVSGQHEPILKQMVLDLSGLLDLENVDPVGVSEFGLPVRQTIAFNSSLSHVAHCDRDGNILVEGLDGPPTTAYFPGRWKTDSPDNHPYLVFSPDDSMLAVRGVDQLGRVLVQVWDIATQNLVLEQEADGLYLDSAVTFVENQSVAFATFDNSVSLADVRTGKLTWTSAPLESAAIWLESTAAGNVLAGSRDVVLLTGQNGRIMGHFSSPNATNSCSVHPLGRFFAVGYGNGEILVWDLTDFEKPAFSLKGHSQRVTTLSYHPQENLLMSSSMDGTTRIWDTVFARPILVAPFGGVRFSTRGDRIGFRTPDNRHGVWKLAGLDQQILANGHLRKSSIRSIDFSSDSQRLGWASEHLGVVLSRTDVPKTQRIFDEYHAASFLAFSRTDSTTLISAGMPTIDRFRFRDNPDDETGNRFVVSREQSMALEMNRAPAVVQTSEDRFLMSDGFGPVLQCGLDEDLTTFDLPFPANQLAIDASGKLLACAGPEQTGVLIWSLENQQPVVELPDNQSGPFALEFDPQDRWLAVSGQGQVSIYEKNTWTQSKTIQPIDSLINGRCAFSPDGKLLAVSEFNSVALYKTGSFQLIGLLRPRNRASIASALVTDSCPLRFSPNSRYLAAGTHANTVILWDIASILRALTETGLSPW